MMCESKGWELATIHSKLESLCAYTAMQHGLGNGANETAWISLNKLDGSDYGWMNEEAISFTSWGLRQNQNASLCVRLDGTSGNVSWYRESCTERLPFLCKRGQLEWTSMRGIMFSPISLNVGVSLLILLVCIATLSFTDLHTDPSLSNCQRTRQLFFFFFFIQNILYLSTRAPQSFKKPTDLLTWRLKNSAKVFSEA